MRTSLKLLAVATLLLPGCILVTKDGNWDDGNSRSKSYASLERRVAELEAAQKHDEAMCEAAACKCMEHEQGEKHEEHAEKAGAH